MIIEKDAKNLENCGFATFIISIVRIFIVQYKHILKLFLCQNIIAGLILRILVAE